MSFRKVIKEFLPPILLRWRPRKNFSPPANQGIFWSGNFESWHQALQHSTGYDEDVILERTLEAVLKVKSGEAVYERDSVLLDKPEYSWPLVAQLLQIAIEHDLRLSIVDFGGALGSSYFQHRIFFKCIRELHWGVVEQAHYINVANEKIAENGLYFYSDIDSCAAEIRPNVLLLSGSLQYLETPWVWLERFKSLNLPYIIFDRTAFIEADADRLTVQQVPESIYKASYPAWFFKKENLISALSDKYDFVDDFFNGFDPDRKLEGTRVYWKGLIFRKSQS